MPRDNLMIDNIFTESLGRSSGCWEDAEAIANLTTSSMSNCVPSHTYGVARSILTYRCADNDVTLDLANSMEVPRCLLRTTGREQWIT